MFYVTLYGGTVWKNDLSDQSYSEKLVWEMCFENQT